LELVKKEREDMRSTDGLEGQDSRKAAGKKYQVLVYALLLDQEMEMPGL